MSRRRRSASASTNGGTSLLTLYPPPILPIILDVTTPLSEVFGPWESPFTFLINGEGTLLSYADEFSGMVVGEWIGLIEQELPRAGGALLPLLE